LAPLLGLVLPLAKVVPMMLAGPNQYGNGQAPGGSACDAWLLRPNCQTLAQGFMQGPMQGQGTMPPQGGGPQA